ncbi:hypothetical protein [Rhizobacter sp. Root404]|uniref:hypothetical protein n=1 Tax=Rhizobacter sp. Root404 TaxID=1736528 RepID=UPI000A6A2373|nr:hypothetical protein [Rhizobacter sp. Root404]
MDTESLYRELRADLTDIPRNADRAASLQELERAFSSTGALATLTNGDALDFYGEATLTAVFGAHLDCPYTSRPLNASRTTPPKHTGLRRRAYRYVVVGELSRDDLRAPAGRASVLLLGLSAKSLAFEGKSPVSANSLTMLRLRSGLMNRRQASLLAWHLNDFRESSNWDGSMMWRVVEGPEPDTSARGWLDSIADPAHFLRREIGEVATWGLGSRATSGIATYRLEHGQRASVDQVFASESPRLILPPRFQLIGDVDDDCQFNDGTWGIVVQRRESCETASALATAAGQGLLSAPTTPDTMTRHDPSDDLGALAEDAKVFFSDEHGRHEYGAAKYALGLSEAETLAAISALSARGYGDFRAVRVGRGGNFNPANIGDTSTIKIIHVDGACPFDVTLSYCR